MTHGVHAVQHEVEHEIKHGDDHGGHKSLLDNINKKVALLIGVLALLLAFSETLGKSAQTGAISYNIEAANLWAFFQAKNIRRTVILTAAEEMTVNAPAASDVIKASMTKQIDTWQNTAVAAFTTAATPSPRDQRQINSRSSVLGVRQQIRLERFARKDKSTRA
jgi:hypothetical protein